MISAAGYTTLTPTQVFAEVVQDAQEAHAGGTTRHEPPNPITVFRDVVEEAQIASGQTWTQRISGVDCVLRSDRTVRAGAHSVGDGGHATYTRNVKKVIMSSTDLVVDTQNVARRVLNPQDYTYFIQTYFEDYLGIADDASPVDFTPEGKDKFFEAHLAKYHPQKREQIATRDAYIRETVGAAFRRYGLFPVKEYLNADRDDVYRAIEKREERRLFDESGE